MPVKPVVTTATDGKTPVFTEQNQTDQEWHSPTGSRDGHHATLGTTTDAAQTDPAQPATGIALAKGQVDLLNQILTALGSPLAVGDATAEAKLEAVRLLLAGTLTTADATAQGKLEAIRALLAGPVNVAVMASSVTDAQSLPVHTIGKRVSLQEINASSSAVVAVGTTNVALVYAPAGKIARVRELGIYISGPVGATSGTHRVMIGLNMTLNNTATNTSVLDSAPTPYNSVIALYRPAWFAAASGQFPTTYQDFQKAKEALVFTDTVPLRIMYVNLTDVAQNGSREVRLLCELEAIV